MIQVTDDLYVDVQADQCVVFRKTGRVDKDGKEVLADQSYPATLEQALKICLRRVLAKELSGDTFELKEAINKAKQIHEKFEAVIKGEIGIYE